MLQAVWNFNLEGLIERLRDPGARKNYEWIRLRIRRMWDLWVGAAKSLAAKPAPGGGQADSLRTRHRKRVRFSVFLFVFFMFFYCLGKPQGRPSRSCANACSNPSL